jgi:hypothetical protein
MEKQRISSLSNIDILTSLSRYENTFIVRLPPYMKISLVVNLSLEYFGDKNPPNGEVLSKLDL